MAPPVNSGLRQRGPTRFRAVPPNLGSRLRHRGRWHRWTLALVTAALCMAGSTPGHAQKLRNRGQIQNTGTFAVRDSVLGLPASLGGTFVMNGLDQLVPARSYQNLSLVSPAVTTKQAAGNLFVSDTLLIGANVTFAVPADSVVTLGIPAGRLTENGYISGRISKTVDLSGPTTLSDFGGIGVSIRWSGAAPGLTSVVRTSGIGIAANGRSSIKRFTDIAATQDDAPTDLEWKYVPDELNGQDPSTLDLWRLPTGETRWRRQPVTRAGTVLTRNGIRRGGRFTAADASNPLDPVLKFEWEADSLRLAGIDSLRGPRSQLLDSLFTVRVTDAFDQALPGVLVTFAVTSRPAGAAQDSLTVVSAVTDVNGRVSTQLRLGDRSGRYEVTAQVPAASSVRPRKFVGYATGSLVASLAKLQGDAQVDSIKTTLPIPFVVRLTDSDSVIVPASSVRFVIATTPAGGETAALSDTLVASDANGLASSVLTLGRRIGRYTVEARSVDVDSLLAVFRVDATHGVPSAVDTASSMRQDTVLRQLAPFLVSVTDGEGNPVRNAPVQFAITSAPAGAAGQSVDIAGTVTDSGGLAAVRLTLGDRVGPYDLTATTPWVPGGVRTFRAFATAAGAATIAEQEGDAQRRPILSLLDTAFVTRVVDRFGNPVPGVPVRFAVVDSPGTAAGQSLSRSVDTTDALGQARTVFRLGLKVGVYAVEADVPGLLPVRFTAVALPGSPKTLAGSLADTLAFISMPAMPFVATVRDTGDNAVPNTAVTFSIIQSPAGAQGSGLTVVSGQTDSLGRISTTLQVGDRTGRYEVLAAAGGLPGFVFAVEARLFLGNANVDLRVDIGDLTAIIDHILGRSVLTGLPFNAADVDTNGVVDVRDAVIARNYLLSGGVWNPSDTSLTMVPFSLLREDILSPAARSLVEAPSGVRDAALGSPVATSTVLEHTTVGIRVSLRNEVPVKGVQIYLHTRRPIESLQSDIRFSRARDMDIIVAADGQEVRAVLYNFSNVPIDSGSGPIFRIPIAGLDTTDVDSISVIISSGPQNLSTVVMDNQVLKTVGVYPTTFALYQNYPNPFNSTTKIEYDVPEVAGRIPRVAIQIFNIVGERVLTIDRQHRDAGRYTIVWDGRDARGATVATGVYFYRLLSVDPAGENHFATTKKMIMVK